MWTRPAPPWRSGCCAVCGTAAPATSSTASKRRCSSCGAAAASSSGRRKSSATRAGWKKRARAAAASPARSPPAPHRAEGRAVIYRPICSVLSFIFSCRLIDRVRQGCYTDGRGCCRFGGSPRHTVIKTPALPVEPVRRGLFDLANKEIPLITGFWIRYGFRAFLIF